MYSRNYHCQGTCGRCTDLNPELKFYKRSMCHTCYEEDRFKAKEWAKIENAYKRIQKDYEFVKNHPLNKIPGFAKDQILKMLEEYGE